MSCLIAHDRVAQELIFATQEATLPQECIDRARNFFVNQLLVRFPLVKNPQVAFKKVEEINIHMHSKGTKIGSEIGYHFIFAFQDREFCLVANKSITGFSSFATQLSSEPYAHRLQIMKNSSCANNHFGHYQPFSEKVKESLFAFLQKKFLPNAISSVEILKCQKTRHVANSPEEDAWYDFDVMANGHKLSLSIESQRFITVEY